MFELPYFLHTYIHDQFEQLSQKSPQARQRLQQAVAQLSQNYLQAKPFGGDPKSQIHQKSLGLAFAEHHAGAKLQCTGTKISA